MQVGFYMYFISQVCFCDPCTISGFRIPGGVRELDRL